MCPCILCSVLLLRMMVMKTHVECGIIMNTVIVSIFSLLVLLVLAVC